jgi:hypothetical protein
MNTTKTKVTFPSNGLTLTGNCSGHDTVGSCRESWSPEPGPALRR